jgi:hypothetical protein
MDRIILKILDEELNFVGSIKKYASFYFVLNFNRAKEFQLIAPIKYEKILKEDYYIYVSRKKSFIINYVKSEEDKGIVTVRGKHVMNELKNWITLPLTGLDYDVITGDAETVLKHYINSNCVNPQDTERKGMFFEIAPNLNRGSRIHRESSHKNLLEEVEEIAKSIDIGWIVELDYVRKKLIFDVYEGVDRAYSQDINNKVIMSKKRKNIENVITTRDISDYKNVNYVAGQGEGAERKIAIVRDPNQTFMKRREMFTDARDIGDDSETTLEDRGLAKLGEASYIYRSESTIVDKNSKYEESWNLGDLVTVQDGLGQLDYRVNEVKEVHEPLKKVDVVIGNIGLNVLERLNKNTLIYPGTQSLKSIDGGGFT